MGLALFIIAIGSGQLIAKEANRTVMIWATQGDLAPGQLISESDIKSVPVLLPESAKNYLGVSFNPYKYWGLNTHLSHYRNIATIRSKICSINS